MTPEIPFSGPSNEQYDATIRLQNPSVPDNLDVSVGDNATIQVVEHTQHGASLYSVSSREKHDGKSSLTYIPVCGYQIC